MCYRRVDKRIALLTLEHMEPERARRALAVGAWHTNGEYCHGKTGLG